MKKEQILKDYFRLKGEYPEAVILYGINGERYVSFDADAQCVAKICKTRTRKVVSSDGRELRQTSVKHYNLKDYVEKLVKSGCKIAIADKL